MTKVINKYLACLLRFQDESNSDAVSRFFDNELLALSDNKAYDIIARWAYDGVMLTPEAFNAQGDLMLDQTGLTPEQIAPLREAVICELDAQRRRQVGADLLSGKPVDLANLGSSAVDRHDIKTLAETLDNGMEAYARRVERVRKNQPVLSFPWSGVSKLVPQIADDDLILLTGLTGTGKSSAALQTAIWNSCHFKTLYFHNEDNDEKLMKRIVAQMQIADDPYCAGTGLSYAEILRNPVSSEEAVARWLSRIKRLLNDKLYTVYCSGWTPEQIVHHWRRAVQQSGIQFVVIDYLNKIEVSHLIDRRGGLAFAYEYAVELFKREAGRNHHNCPCLLVQQEIEKNKTRDTRASNTKAQIVISLERDTDDQGNLPSGHIHVIKANDGATGNTPAKFYSDYMLWMG